MTNPKVYVADLGEFGAIFIRTGKIFHSEKYAALRNLSDSMEIFFAGARQGPEYDGSVLTYGEIDKIQSIVNNLEVLGYEMVAISFSEEGTIIWPDEEE